MAFQKYEEVKVASPVDVRAGKLGISVTKAALERHHLSGATMVNLYYDPETGEIGITPAETPDKSSFRMNPRGKQGDKFIAAGKFYARFGIQLPQRKVTGELVDRDGILAFPLTPQTAAQPRRRAGRRKKETVTDDTTGATTTA